MNTQQVFRFPHIDQSMLPIDARAKASPTLPWTDCYCVGFRVSTQSEDSFVHTMILADSFARLLYGIDLEKESILAHPSDKHILRVDVVYLRSMQTLDNDFITPETREEIEDLTRNTLSKRDDAHFVVFGVIGETQLILLDILTSDAMTAISLARFKRINSAPQDFTILGVRQAHPVSVWFESMFEGATRRMSAIEDRETHYSGLLH